MIPFFRIIRKQLAAENKALKYMRYAFGEIILVVVGILIALQINNWNENRILQFKSQSYLFEFVNSLKSDTSKFSRGVILYENLIKLKEPELLKSDLSKATIEDLENLITPKYYAFRITENTYLKAKNSGLTELTEHELLSEKINTYYTEILDYHNTMIDWEIEFTNKEAEYWFYEQAKYETRSPDKFPVFQKDEENRISLIRLLESPKGRNYLRSEFDRKQRLINHFEYMYNKALELIKEIQKELDN